MKNPTLSYGVVLPGIGRKKRTKRAIAEARINDSEILVLKIHLGSRYFLNRAKDYPVWSRNHLLAVKPEIC